MCMWGRAAGAALPLFLLAVSGAYGQLTNNGAKLGTKCPDVCGLCNDDGSCLYCAPGTMQVGNASSTGAVTCVKCQDPLCMSCGPTVDKCEMCYPAWPWPTGPDWVDPIGPVYQDATGRCLKCKHLFSSGCRWCNTLGHCEQCDQGFVLSNINGTCKKCKGGVNCTECSPTTQQCTKCTEDNGLDSKQQCRQCATGMDMFNSSACIDCQKDYRVCKACYPWYYISEQQKCVEVRSVGHSSCKHDGHLPMQAYRRIGLRWHVIVAMPLPLPVACIPPYCCAAATGLCSCKPERRMQRMVRGGVSQVLETCTPCYSALGMPILRRHYVSCTFCLRSTDGFVLNSAKKCVPCGYGCVKCTTATTCASCNYNYVLSPQKQCLPCSPGCDACKFVPPGQALCTACSTLSLVNGECRRCDDPRCADCSGNEHRCKRCRNEKHVVNKATGRCEDPSWPVPCRVAPGPGRRGGCTSTVHRPPVRKPSTNATGGRLRAAGVKPAIVGGHDAPRGRYPYMASQRISYDVYEAHNCGGALVHQRVVMLAAHCVLSYIDWSYEEQVFGRIRIGGYELEQGLYEVRRVKWAVVHPAVAYTETGYLVNDIALLLLDRPSTMRPLLHLPPALPRPAVAPGTLLTAIGWGQNGRQHLSSYRAARGDGPAWAQACTPASHGESDPTSLVARPMQQTHEGCFLACCMRWLEGSAERQSLRIEHNSTMHALRIASPAELLQGTIEMLPLKQCAAQYAGFGSYPTIPPMKWDSQFCAGRPDIGVDPCMGDDGGPLVWKGPTGDVAVGVTTMLTACGSSMSSVYADVAAASNWIRNAIQWMLYEDAAGRIPGPGPA